MTAIKYEAAPTPARFHASDVRRRGIMGPVGSGKSVACVMELFMRACAQEPHEGVRSTRFAIFRNTFPELKSTTIKTVQEWLPEELLHITWGSPITGKLKMSLGDGTVVDSEWLFAAVDQPKDVKKLLSLEVTGVWLNEVRELPKSLLDMADTRIGRYPAKRRGGPTWRGIIMDTNPPDDDHWYYQLAEVEKPDGFMFYRQPGGMVPDGNGGYIANLKAENVKHLDGGYAYYSSQLGGKTGEWIKVYIMGQYGSVFDGRPVYEHVWNDALHVAKEPLSTFRGLPLRLGWDFGLTPSCIVGQMSPKGQVRILREYTCERGGIRQFVTDVVRPALNNEFPGMPLISTGDPAGTQGAQGDVEITCFGELERLGILSFPAATNDLVPRRQAVINALTRTIDGEPGFLLDPSCTDLRKGFNGGYQFSRVQVSGEERYRDVPNKNRFSHPHDALQYLMLEADKGNRPSSDGEHAKFHQESTWGAYI